ncbi:MAG: hypothetical protein KC422_06440 [Trueperaceae bacterium]|nr:hypothetical protein [Trueperaceae bacterium]
MTISLADKQLNIDPIDRLSFQWMLERLLEERPSFSFFKAQLNGESVVIFTRHQNYLGKRWPSLLVTAQGWENPLIIADKDIWVTCYNDMLAQDVAKTA